MKGVEGSLRGRTVLRPGLWRVWFLFLALVPFVFAAIYLAGYLGRDSGATGTVLFDDRELPQGCNTGPCMAIFAAGCFWCTEADFEKLHDVGILDVASGYTGGPATPDPPSYEEVCTGGTGHVEAALVVYNPNATSYASLLAQYWRNVDPFDGEGQFCDKGSSYRPAIFFTTEAQRNASEAFRARLERDLGRRVEVMIRPATVFYLAENYHQDYYKKNEASYAYYRGGCGRDARLKEVWRGYNWSWVGGVEGLPPTGHEDGPSFLESGGRNLLGLGGYTVVLAVSATARMVYLRRRRGRTAHGAGTGGAGVEEEHDGVELIQRSSET